MSCTQGKNMSDPFKDTADVEEPAKTEDEDLVTKLVEERLGENLKPIKEKLDNAFAARDEALRKVAEYEQKEKAAELKRLQEEGKHKEVFELQLAEEKAKSKALEKQNIELTRDIELKGILAEYTFKSSNAASMAYKEIVSDLLQNENGKWIHRSGASIRDFVKSFSENSDNSFLFKQKTSSGSGSAGVVTNKSMEKPSSIFDLTQEEVLQRAREGKLR